MKEMKTRAVIYARYSTAEQKKESAEAQIEACQKLATDNGLDVVEVFQDRGISGGHQDRPDFQRMLAFMEAEQADYLLLWDTSRFSRESWVLPKLAPEFKNRDQFILTCDGYDSRAETATILGSIKSAFDQVFLEKLAKDTHRGQTSTVEKGWHAGGKTYGYSTEEVSTDEDRKDSRKRKVVDPVQAQVVREIFQMYADGMSARAIAAELNRRGIPSPGASWNRKGGLNGKRKDAKWLGHTIYGNFKRGTGILANELYIGNIVWNRSHCYKVMTDDGVKRKRRENSDKKWVRASDPSLRIVPPELWDKVQARRQATRTATRPDLQVQRARSTGAAPKYVLSGLLVCNECGYRYVMADRYSYICGSHRNGGKYACGNKLRVKRREAERTILGTVADPAYWDEWLHSQTEHFLKALQAEQRREQEAQLEYVARKAELEAELRDAERKLQNLADAVAEAGFSETLKTELRKQEQRRETIEQQLVVVPLRDFEQLPGLLKAGAEHRQAEIQKLKDDVLGPEASPRKVAMCRSYLRKLLGEVRLEPDYETEALYAFIGFNEKAGPAWILAATKPDEISLDKINVVAGAGFGTLSVVFNLAA